MSAGSHPAFDGINQLLRVPPNAIFEDQLDLLNILDSGGWIALDDHNVVVFPDCQRTDVVGLLQERRAALRSGLEFRAAPMIK
jgi:hypothetical protein